MVEGASPQGHIFSKRGVPLGLYHVRSLVSLITPTAQAGYHAINIAGRNDSWQRMGCVIEVTPQCRVRTQFYQKISAWPFRSHQRCKRKALLPSSENFEVSTPSERSHEAMHINITLAEMIVRRRALRIGLALKIMAVVSWGCRGNWCRSVSKSGHQNDVGLRQKGWSKTWMQKGNLRKNTVTEKWAMY